MKNLNPWARQAVEHWRKYRPKMYAQLFANGELYDRAQKAAEQTQQEYQDGITRGLLPHESWEMVRQNHIFLPTEEDVPHLGESPVSSQDPTNLATTTVSPPKTTSGKAARGKNTLTTLKPSESSRTSRVPDEPPHQTSKAS